MNNNASPVWTSADLRVCVWTSVYVHAPPRVTTFCRLNCLLWPVRLNALTFCFAYRFSAVCTENRCAYVGGSLSAPQNAEHSRSAERALGARERTSPAGSTDEFTGTERERERERPPTGSFARCSARTNEHCLMDLVAEWKPLEVTQNEPSAFCQLSSARNRSEIRILPADQRYRMYLG